MIKHHPWVVKFFDFFFCLFFPMTRTDWEECWWSPTCSLEFKELEEVATLINSRRKDKRWKCILTAATYLPWLGALNLIGCTPLWGWWGTHKYIWTMTGFGPYDARYNDIFIQNNKPDPVDFGRIRHRAVGCVFHQVFI